MKTAKIRKVIDRALDRDFTRVGKSGIAGTGVFAKRKIPKGSRIIEYKGTRRTREEILLDHQNGKPQNVYLFGLDGGKVIDGTKRGNDARYINHSCEPNCETYAFDEKIFVYAIRDIVRGEELTFDYNLRSAFGIKNEPNKNICNCGTPSCRGTMYAKKGKTKKK